MTEELSLPFYGRLEFTPGWPPLCSVLRLPTARSLWLAKDFGSIFIQEVRCERYLFRYFVFHFLKQLSLEVRERGEGVQSMLCMRGEFSHSLEQMPQQHIPAGHFTLLDAGSENTEAVIPAGKPCQLFNTYYPEGVHDDIFSLFPSFDEHPGTQLKMPRYFLPSPKLARPALLDTIRELLRERYKPELQKYYWELKLREALFTQLAQAYTEEGGPPCTPFEREMVMKARSIIEENIAVHHSNEAIAKKINWSESSLKRAFRQEFGMGMFEYLRKLRMEKAKELLHSGEQAKNAASAVGMRLSNFTTEFKKYFGYNPSLILNEGK